MERRCGLLYIILPVASTTSSPGPKRNINVKRSVIDLILNNTDVAKVWTLSTYIVYFCWRQAFFQGDYLRSYYVVCGGVTYFLLFKKKYPVDFDDELKIGDVRYDDMTEITIKVQLFWRLPYEIKLCSKMKRFWVISDSKKVVFWKKKCVFIFL